MRCTRAERLAVLDGRAHINAQKAWQEVVGVQDNDKRLDDNRRVESTAWQNYKGDRQLDIGRINQGGTHKDLEGGRLDLSIFSKNVTD